MNPATLRLFLYALVPTGVELVCCFLAAVAITFVEFVKYTAVNLLFHMNGDLGLARNNQTERRQLIGALVVAVVLGVVVYLALYLLSRKHEDSRSAETAIHKSVTSVHIRRRLLLATWRSAVIVFGIYFTLGILPMLYGRTHSGVDFYITSASRVGLRILFMTLLWMGVVHVYVVMTRLYMVRARIFSGTDPD